MGEGTFANILTGTRVAERMDLLARLYFVMEIQEWERAISRRRKCIIAKSRNKIANRLR